MWLRAFRWWLAQVRHALPAVIFFFCGFNLIGWTKQMILQEHGIAFSAFILATVAALLVGKAVLSILEEVLGDEYFTPEMETAWRKAYAEIARSTSSSPI